MNVLFRNYDGSINHSRTIRQWGRMYFLGMFMLIESMVFFLDSPAKPHALGSTVSLDRSSVFSASLWPYMGKEYEEENYHKRLHGNPVWGDPLSYPLNELTIVEMYAVCAGVDVQREGVTPLGCLDVKLDVNRLDLRDKETRQLVVKACVSGLHIIYNARTPDDIQPCPPEIIGNVSDHFGDSELERRFRKTIYTKLAARRKILENNRLVIYRRAFISRCVEVYSQFHTADGLEEFREIATAILSDSKTIEPLIREIDKALSH